jgi:Dyp-type peroxidase family
MGDDADPLLDGEDIQGNIFPGFNRSERYLVAFASTDGARLKRVLARLRPDITTLSVALGHRDERKFAFLAGVPAPARSDLWLNIALGPRAINALGANDVATLDVGENSPFSQGMTPSLLGDPYADKLANGAENEASRANWIVGSSAKPADILLIFAHDSDTVANAEPIVTEVGSLLGAEPVYREIGRMLPGEAEHFGFRDGISQPGLRGKIMQDATQRLLTTRYGVPPREGVEFGKAGQPLVWPGQFLTGAPSGPGDHPHMAPELRNGSFLVFRRLRQDVGAFYADTNDLARQLSIDSGYVIDGAGLRARIVGRFPSGASLMRHARDPIVEEDPNAVNHFEFGVGLPPITLDDGTKVEASAADPDVVRGRRCPVWAHIRKVNPRDQPTDRGGRLETIGFQMLRRGIPFGPAFDHSVPDDPANSQDRGLLFLAYQRSIDHQFLVLNSDWMNTRTGPQAGGHDLLVGQFVPDDSGGQYSTKTANFFGPRDGDQDPQALLKATGQWVVPTGGGFFFSPSLAFIEKYSTDLVAES